MIVDWYRFAASGPPTVPGDPFLTGLDFSGATLRNDFGGYVGCRIGLPSWQGAYTVITGLGRYIVPGNTGMHDLYLFRMDDVGTPDYYNSPDQLAMLTIDTSLYPGGTMGYVPFPTPIAHEAYNGYHYGIYSREFNGGDQWVDGATYTGDAYFGYGDIELSYDYTQPDPGHITPSTLAKFTSGNSMPYAATDWKVAP